MPVYALDDQEPQIPDSAYVADEATLVGRITLGERASVWHGAIIRAEEEPITIGAGSNVQDGAVLHVDPGFPLTIGANVTIGHQAMLHGCTVGDGALIGIQAVVLNGAVIGAGSLVGAGAVVTEGKVFPPRSLIVGAPARVIRELTDDDAARVAEGGPHYAELGDIYKTRLRRVR